MTPIVNCIQDMLVDCATMLDVGVGTGRFALPLSEKGVQIVGVDISAPMLGQARRKGVRHLVRADARGLPFRDDAFDAVLMVHLLHLVDDWIRVIREIGRVSSRLVMTVISTPRVSPVMQDYIRLREEMGYPLRRLKNAETDLSLLVPPGRRRHAVDHAATKNAETMISSLERGDFALSWDLPKGIHSKIIEWLRSKYGQKDYSRKYLYEVLTWVPEQLRGFKEPTKEQ